MDQKLQKRLFRLGADIVAQGEIPVDVLKSGNESDKDGQSFSGRVEGVDILDYLQFLMLSGQSTVVEISSRNGSRGKIYVKSGEVAHAVCPPLDGEEALYKCLTMKGGRFFNGAWKEPEKQTINKPGDLLLFEAARIRDEERQPKNAAAT
jgi:hypothetical protein